MSAGTAVQGLTFADVEVGTEITPVSLPITYKRICMNAASTWDWFPGHHDPEYAVAHSRNTRRRWSPPAAAGSGVTRTVVGQSPPPHHNTSPPPPETTGGGGLVVGVLLPTGWS